MLSAARSNGSPGPRAVSSARGVGWLLGMFMALWLAWLPPALAQSGGARRVGELRRAAQRRRPAAQLRRQLRAAAWRRRGAEQGRAAVLRGRGRGLPRPLVLARQARRQRRARVAHRLPAAHLQLPRHLRRHQPELRLACGGLRVHPPRVEAGRSPSRRSWRRARGTTSSSASGSTPRCCRGRCRSASARSPTGRCRSSVPSASTEH